MKNRIIAIFVILTCVLCLSACSCSHESWVEAEETGATVCENCGIFICDVDGHTWAAATCETPKTCEGCKLTDGEALGHSWSDADCENAKTCGTCFATEGNSLGHSWIDATTEAPKTCETCFATEGERIITDERFKTSECSMLFGTWEGILSLSGDEFEFGFGDYLEVFDCIYSINFSNDGKMTITIRPADEKQFTDAMVAYTVDYFYEEMAASGFSAADVDALMEQSFGMTVEEYMGVEMASMDIAELFSAFSVNFVYFVEGNQMFIGLTWDAMEMDFYTLEGETLYLPIDESGEDTVFTRVSE